MYCQCQVHYRRTTGPIFGRPKHKKTRPPEAKINRTPTLVIDIIVTHKHHKTQLNNDVFNGAVSRRVGNMFCSGVSGFFWPVLPLHYPVEGAAGRFSKPPLKTCLLRCAAVSSILPSEIVIKCPVYFGLWRNAFLPVFPSSNRCQVDKYM